MSEITVEEMCKEIIANKHNELNIFFMEKQKTIKGFIKNVVLVSEADEKSITFSLQEIKNDEQILAKHSCKKNCNSDGEKKDRINLDINSVEQLNSIEKNSMPDKLTYKLDFGDETIGIVVKL